MRAYKKAVAVVTALAACSAKVKETIDFLLNREEAHNAMFQEAFNKVQSTGSNRDFGTTKTARMYFSMSEPSPTDIPFPSAPVKPPSFG